MCCDIRTASIPGIEDTVSTLRCQILLQPRRSTTRRVRRADLLKPFATSVIAYHPCGYCTICVKSALRVISHNYSDRKCETLSRQSLAVKAYLITI